jgi:hypothetical protein
LQVIKLPEAKKGFVRLPKRWGAEGSIGLLNRFWFCRLVRDYGRLPETLATVAAKLRVTQHTSIEVARATM